MDLRCRVGSTTTFKAWLVALSKSAAAATPNVTSKVSTPEVPAVPVSPADYLSVGTREYYSKSYY